MSGETLDSLQRIVDLRLRFDKFLVIGWFACIHFIFVFFCVCVCNYCFPLFQSREAELQKLDSLLLEFAKRAAVCG